MKYHDIGLDLLDANPLIEYEFMSEWHEEVTPDGVRRPMAQAIMALLYALSTKH